MADLQSTLAAALDGYTIERELGHGGMATVFLAHDRRHDRPVALKVLHADLAHALGPERFQREIRLAARLQHPHILTVFDSGEAAGFLWFTMPFVEGESLRDRLERERQLPVEDALRIAREAALALGYAHEHGVVHRDIKPENLLLTKDGSTLVADFGIARSLAGGDRQLTETGLAIGTPAYMSPEQASGEHDVTARTDIYSLGAVLFEMLAGEPPFTGPTAQAVIAKRFSGEVPSVRKSRPAIPEAVDRAISRALAPVPADRWSTAAEFARALVPAADPAVTTPMSLPAIERAPSPAKRRRPSPALVMLVLGFAIGVGALFAWRQRHADTGPTATKTVAVLPFENLGTDADEYFADGITDEVRGKLAGLPGLTVIADGSSKSYKHSTKPLGKIAAELGVDYLLVAKVRWATAPDGSRQVRVSPELVQVSGGTSAVRWQEPFDAPVTNIFQMQTDIAGEVAGALKLALGSDQQQQLAARPTKSLPAYDAFLRGRAIGSSDPASNRARLALYEQAVSLDPTFAEAWGALSQALSGMYVNGVPDSSIAHRARSAAERALTLEPENATGWSAIAGYYLNVENDPAEADRQISRAPRSAATDPFFLASASNVERSMGRLDEALRNARQARTIDPRSFGAALREEQLLMWMRRFPEARAANEAAVSISPNVMTARRDGAMMSLAAGNLADARAVPATMSPPNDPVDVATYFALYWDLYWVLDDATQRRILTVDSTAFDNDPASWATVLMEISDLRGDHAKARSYAEAAYRATVAQMKAAPRDPQRPLIAGLQLAVLGRKAEAIESGLRGLALSPMERDRWFGPYYQQLMARIYMMAGEPDKAVDLLETILKEPYFLTPAWLRIDPTWTALRSNPRFQRLVSPTT
jgi:serine/threonine-protein kinase